MRRFSICPGSDERPGILETDDRPVGCMRSVKQIRLALEIVEAETRRSGAQNAEQAKHAAEISLSRLMAVPQRVEAHYDDRTSSKLRVHVSGPDLFGGFTIALEPTKPTTTH